MTLGQIKEATCSSTFNAEKFIGFINGACTKYDISTPIRQLCFLAQVGHESGSLFFIKELAGGAAYEGRKSPGNIMPGEGIWFKGLGLIQISRRTNYKAVGDDLGLGLSLTPHCREGKLS